MKALYDILSIIIFVIAYLFYGFYVAVAVINILMFFGVIAHRIKYGKHDRLQVTIFLLVLILSLPTFILHEEIFFKWKPSIISWLFGIGLLLTQYMGAKKTLFQRLLEKEKIHLPAKSFSLINYLWVVYFILFGFLNIYVAYHYPTNIWVWFKLVGSLGTMLIMCIVTAILLYPHIKEHQIEKKPDNETTNG